MSGTPAASTAPGFAVAGVIAPTALSAPYRLGLTVVAVAMLLLPLVYLALVAGAAAVVWWHLTGNAWLLEDVSRTRAFLYVAPAVIGVAIVFFMVKPVLARPGRPRRPVALLPQDEPELFAFIEQICRQVRAPVPRRVQVDCQVNASASFLPGRFSLFKKDLVLTIGLPLVAGLSIRELGGVLAHEFGHFAQGAGMRLTMLVRGINAWFARVVYERDHWDQKLETWSKEWDMRVGFVLVVARGFIWLSRRLLHGLMLAGHAISCFMLRQMEYDADSYEIKFAGSEAFVRTSARMRELNAGVQFGYNDLQHSWRQRALPADLPAFLIERSRRVPDDVLASLRRVPDGSTGVFDTHPSDADRVRAAEAASSPGVLVGGDGPATLLFQNLETLSTKATRHHYAHDLGLDLEQVALVALTDAVDESRRREDGEKALAGFFGERVSLSRPLLLPVAEVERLSESEVLAAVTQAEADMMAASTGDVTEGYRRYEGLAVRRDKAVCAEELMLAGLTISPDFEVADSTAAGARSTASSAATLQQRDAPILDRFETAAARLLACRLALAARRSPPVDRRPLVEAFNAIAKVMPDLQNASGLFLAAMILSRANEGADVPATVGDRLRHVEMRVGKSIDRLRQALDVVPCPEGFSSQTLTVAAYCGLSGSSAVNPSDVVERVRALYSALLGQLVIAAGAEESRA